MASPGAAREPRAHHGAEQSGTPVWPCCGERSEIRANGVGLKLGDFLTAFCWGCCVFVTYSKQDLYNDHAFKTNMGLQSAIVLAFLYQGLTRGDEGDKKKSS